MADEATTTNPDEAAGGAAEGGSVNPAPGGEQAPPWGDDFDPSRAWQTITRQREEEKALRARLSEFEKAQKAREDAEKSESERMSEALETARREAAEARREVLVSRAAVKHSLPEKVLAFITGTTAEEVEEQAATLAEMLGAGVKPPAAEVPGKPRPALKPGQGGGDGPAEIDPDAVAERIRSRRF